MRILVAEDEQLLADRLASGLRRQSFAVDVAYAGDTALELLAINSYDVLVLVASQARTRVLMLTAAGSLRDRVDGLDLGADDYLGKPFEYPELVARIRALARRSQPALPPTLQRAGISLDPARRQVFRDGMYIPLSRKEFAVLELLMAADGAVVSQEDLLARAWDEHADPFTNTVRVTVSKLRAKLGAPSVITTVPCAGYTI
jgi:DNA-binding response OmpR family regulator